MNRFTLGLVVGLLCCGFGASGSTQDTASFNLLKLAGKMFTGKRRPTAGRPSSPTCWCATMWSSLAPATATR